MFKSRWTQLWLACLINVWLCLSAVTPIQADENFFSSLHTTYTVESSGPTHVRHAIILKNKTPTMYARQYGIKLSSPNLTRVNVSSNGKTLPAEVVATATQTSIGITFPDQLLGQDKAREIIITYDNPDIGIVSGQVLEVLIPKLGDSASYNEYLVTLQTAQSFGETTRVNPQPTTSSTDGRYNTATFTPHAGESITALFGTEQVFDLKLRFHLQNDSSNTGLMQVALPPDTSFQKMKYDTLEPLPQKIELDTDGNWIATYEVPASTTTEVNASLQTHVTLKPGRLQKPAHQTKDYLLSQPYWESTNSIITELANEYNNPRSIYDFVVNTLSYNYAAIDSENKRLGAVETLASPELATCQEFTDVFVAISRAAGVPARRVTGYAYAQNNQLRPLSLVEDILHAWPEYYDQKQQQWIPIDPTWGNTTGGVNYFDQFDLNHIVFAINGISSSAPFPAGSYKRSNTLSKDVEVTFGQEFTTQPFAVNFTTSPRTLSGVSIPGLQYLKLKNTTGQAWYNIELNLDEAATDTDVSQRLPRLLPILLPYQEVSIPLTASGTDWFTSSQVQLQLQIGYDNQELTGPLRNQESREITITKGPRWLQVIQASSSIISLVGLGFICAVIAGSVLVFRSRRSGSVRRKS
ncbi:MAG: transglutaminase domain-containing protein [bacterium]|nr:transglutaminase domain-containing protein [bacterium]